MGYKGPKNLNCWKYLGKGNEMFIDKNFVFSYLVKQGIAGLQAYLKVILLMYPGKIDKEGGSRDY